MGVWELLGAYYVRVGKPYGRYLTLVGYGLGLVCVVLWQFELVSGGIAQLAMDASGLGLIVGGFGLLSNPYQSVSRTQGIFSRKFMWEEGVGSARSEWPFRAVFLGLCTIGAGIALVVI